MKMGKKALRRAERVSKALASQAHGRSETGISETPDVAVGYVDDVIANTVVQSMNDLPAYRRVLGYKWSYRLRSDVAVDSLDQMINPARIKRW